MLTYLVYIVSALCIILVLVSLYLIYCYISNKNYLKNLRSSSNSESNNLLINKTRLNIFLNLILKAIKPNKDGIEPNNISKMIAKGIKKINKLIIRILGLSTILTIILLILAIVLGSMNNMFNTVVASIVTIFGDDECYCYAKCTGDSELDSKCTYEILFGTEEFNKLVSAANMHSETEAMLSEYESGKQKGELLINYINNEMIICYKEIVTSIKGFRSKDGLDRTKMSDAELRDDLIALLKDYKLNGKNPLCKCDDYNGAYLSFKCKGESHYKSGWSWEDIWNNNNTEEDTSSDSNSGGSNKRGSVGHATPGKYTVTLSDGLTYYWYHQSSCKCVHNVNHDTYGRISAVKTGKSRGTMADRGCSIYSTSMALSNVLDEEITPYVVITDVLGDTIKQSNGLYYFDGNSDKGISMGGPTMTKSTLANRLESLYGEKGLKAKVVHEDQGEFDDILVNKNGLIIFSVDGTFDWYSGGGHFIVIRKKADNLYYHLNSAPPRSAPGSTGDEKALSVMSMGITWDTLKKHLRNGEGVGVWVEGVEYEDTNNNAPPIVTREDVYKILAGNSKFSGKAVAMANTYAAAQPIFGRNFAIGLMANVFAEGNYGKIEGMWTSNSSSYGTAHSCSYKQGRGSYVKSYWVASGVTEDVHALNNKTISNMSMVDTLLTIPNSVKGIGVGTIQWSWGRRIGLLELYKANANTFSTDELATIEVTYMMQELQSGYSKAKQAASSGSAADNAYNICYYYEIPANTAEQATIRANVATELDNLLSSID